MNATLYRFFDADDQLLYAGISRDPLTRWAAHRGNPWWRMARRVTLEHYDDVREARAAERRAIETENPRFNGEQFHRDVKVSPADRRYSRREIVEEFRAAILDGRLPPGATLPSGREIANAFRVSMGTVMLAKRELLASGLVRSMGTRAPIVWGPNAEAMLRTAPFAQPDDSAVPVREDHPK